MVHHRADAEAITGLGLNFVRLSHYPQSPDFLNACDELGVLVMPEIASWKSVRGGKWLVNAVRQLRGMIARDQHHPSVICWGLGNESRHREAFVRMGDVVRQSDPTRPTIYAENHLYRGRRHRTLDLVDVLGVNYELTELDAARDRSRNQVVLVTEMSNCPRPRGDRDGEKEQIETLLADLDALEDKTLGRGLDNLVSGGLRDHAGKSAFAVSPDCWMPGVLPNPLPGPCRRACRIDRF